MAQNHPVKEILILGDTYEGPDTMLNSFNALSHSATALCRRAPYSHSIDKETEAWTLLVIYLKIT